MAWNKERSEELEQMMDEIHGDKAIKSEVNGMDIYTTFAFENTEGRDIYGMQKSGGFHTQLFKTKEAAVGSIENYGNAGLVEIENIEGSIQEKVESLQNRKAPKKEVKIFVHVKNDGRKKDDWQYYRGENEKQIRDEEDLSKPDEEGNGYHYIGSVQEVIETENPEQSFDLPKNFSGKIFNDLRFMAEKNQLKEIREKYSENHEA